MNILLLYPKCPDSYWSFKHALKFINKKAAVPPLGLITASALLPPHWNKKLIDLNIEPLDKQLITWADYVFISAMYIQKPSVNEVLEICNTLNTKVIAGGPLFTQEYENYPQIDHFILNEAEITLPPFINDVVNGTATKKIYKTERFADLQQSPTPDHHLLKAGDYVYMTIQLSRGCPFSCDFCEITSLLGKKVRIKTTRQIIHEMDTLYKLNWRGHVFFVDDNFIGSLRYVKNELLPAVHQWMKEHQFPFTFTTQTSINLADNPELLALMVDAGFISTFIGIETPDELALQGCNKNQNINRNLLENVRFIQNSGMQVSGGFIVGFDNDTPSVFQNQIDFIQQSGIVSAMVGLLNAPKHTELYNRLEKENRLTVEASGSNTDMTMNFKPAMDKTLLLSGYKDIIRNIYGVKPYYSRVRKFLKNYRPRKVCHRQMSYSNLNAFFRSIFVIGILNKGRGQYWSFLIWTVLHKPQLLVEAVTYTVYGYHYRNVFGINRKN